MLDDRDYMRSGQSYARRPNDGFLGTVNGKLIFACVLVFVIQNIAGSLFGEGCLWGPGVRRGEVYRLITYAFLHGGLFHLLANMWMLYLFGGRVERAIGGKRFTVLYFASALFGGGLWLVFNWQSTVPVVGASGAVMGVVAAAAMLFPDDEVMLLFPPIPMTLRTLAIVTVCIETFLEVSRLGEKLRIAHLAHLGGFACGIGYVWWAQRKKSGTRRKAKGRRAHPAKPNLRRVGPVDDVDDKVNEILDKINREGPSSLTAAEKRILDEASGKKR